MRARPRAEPGKHPGDAEVVHWWRDVFSLRRIAADTYTAGPARSAFNRLYGGQIAAQSLLAAAETVGPDSAAHSLHTSFLRAGDGALAVTYRVDRVRDSRSVSTRVVTAEQAGRLLATAIASFHTPPSADAPPSVEHEWPSDYSARVRPPPEPTTLPTRAQSLAERFDGHIPEGAADAWPVDLRYVDRTPWSDSSSTPPRNRLWMRAPGFPRDIAGADAAAVAFATDLPMFEPVFFPTDIAWRDVISHNILMGSSLDHTVWFHRPANLDDWLLLEQFAPVAHRYRGFCRGELRSRAGQLVASVAQEMVFVAPRGDRP